MQLLIDYQKLLIIPYIRKYVVPVIISSGNPNYAFYKVLEKLIKTGNEIYYNGDFDPEGLVIASNLYQKFSQIKFFCYHKKTMKHQNLKTNYLKVD